MIILRFDNLGECITKYFSDPFLNVWFCPFSFIKMWLNHNYRYGNVVKLTATLSLQLYPKYLFVSLCSWVKVKPSNAKPVPIRHKQDTQNKEIWQAEAIVEERYHGVVLTSQRAKITSGSHWVMSSDCSGARLSARQRDTCTLDTVCETGTPDTMSDIYTPDVLEVYLRRSWLLVDTKGDNPSHIL